MDHFVAIKLNIPQNTELYWVNNEISQSNTGSKLFTTKDLSPDSL